MPVAITRSLNTATFTVTVDVSDLRADASLTSAQRLERAVERARQELQTAGDSLGRSDAQIDAEYEARVAAAAADRDRRKAAKPTGAL